MSVIMHPKALPLISVAPMMNCTDRHARYFLRLIAPHVRLYTEMITTQALIHGDRQRFLAFHPDEKYLALQLGGSDPLQLAQCATWGEEAGYDEINLNVGCPSSRVCSGQFGARLMLDANRVADCVHAMQACVTIPVTVKCRIGVDEQDTYAYLQHFIKQVASAGCHHFIIHARKAWLSGLSPKQNRDIPPLRYEMVQQIKRDNPQLTIILNGGIKNLADVVAQLPHVDGVMIGRAAYANPYVLAAIEQHYFAEKNFKTRHQVIEQLLPYLKHQLLQGVKLNTITRHLFGLFQGIKGAAAWRRYLSENAWRKCADVAVVIDALAQVPITEGGDECHG